MKYVNNERGIALVMALILSLIVLAAVSALLYLVTQGTAMSGYQKRYQTALEAAKGTVNIWGPEIISQTIGSTDLSTTKNSITGVLPITFPTTTSNTCLQQKLTLPVSGWGSCGTDNKSIDPTVNPDAIMTFASADGAAEFKTYVKIVGTTTGNSDTGGLDLGVGLGVVEGSGGATAVSQTPYLYRLEVQAQRTTNPDEHANLSVLYAY